jgi:hypothetical protein
MKIADEEVHTHRQAGDYHGNKLCQCRQCGIVKRCSPDFDFYVRPKDSHLKRKPYYCMKCLLDDKKTVERAMAN